MATVRRQASTSSPLDELRKHGHVLTVGRYVGAEAAEDDGAKLDAAIAANLKELGFQCYLHKARQMLIIGDAIHTCANSGRHHATRRNRGIPRHDHGG